MIRQRSHSRMASVMHARVKFIELRLAQLTALMELLIL